jgi:hypothetical protein
MVLALTIWKDEPCVKRFNKVILFQKLTQKWLMMFERFGLISRLIKLQAEYPSGLSNERSRCLSTNAHEWTRPDYALKLPSSLISYDVTSRRGKIGSLFACQR